MKTYDILLTWPTSVDFPIFRKFLKDHCSTHKIYIYLQDTLIEPDFSAFLRAWFKKHCPGTTFVKDNGEQKDWRDLAVNSMLKSSSGEHIWFTEQDFFVKEPQNFFKKVGEDLEHISAISFRQGNRLHPACLFTNRKDVIETRMDFSANPPISDHFGLFSEDLEKICPAVDLNDIGLVTNKDWFHHSGLSQNYVLAERDQVPNYDIPNFLVYNANSRECEVEQDPRYVALTHRVERLLTDVKEFV